MNIETLLVQWLSRQSELENISVSTDTPAEHPERFITVERTGGNATVHGLIDHPTVAIQCWAPTRTQAGDLASLLASVLARAPEVPQVKQCSINSMANFPLDGSHPRYQLTVDLTVQAAG